MWCPEVPEIKAGLLTRCFRSSDFCDREELLLELSRSFTCTRISITHWRNGKKKRQRNRSPLLSGKYFAANDGIQTEVENYSPPFCHYLYTKAPLVCGLSHLFHSVFGKTAQALSSFMVTMSALLFLSAAKNAGLAWGLTLPLQDSTLLFWSHFCVALAWCLPFFLAGE